MAINPTIYVMFEYLTLMNVRVLLKKKSNHYVQTENTMYSI